MGDYAELERMKVLGIKVPAVRRSWGWAVFVGAALLLLSIGFAFAQTPQQATPSQIAVGVEQAVGQLSQYAEGLQRENAGLKEQLSQLQKQLDAQRPKVAPDPLSPGVKVPKPLPKK